MAVTASFKKESPMDEILNGKSIKANFEAQVTAALMSKKNRGLINLVRRHSWKLSATGRERKTAGIKKDDPKGRLFKIIGSGRWI